MSSKNVVRWYLPAMSFSFGFSAADLSDDELETLGQPNLREPVVPNCLDVVEIAPENRPKAHTLKDILHTLIGVRLTFDAHQTAGGNVVYRRALFDIKHQVMTEDVPSTLASDFLVDEDDTDLKKNVYEGGFKSWECSYDLVDRLAAQCNSGLLEKKQTVLDMGCGTALPSCFLLQEMLQKKSPGSLILSDFNYDVLRLVTVPNLFIHWASTVEPEVWAQVNQVEGALLEKDEVIVSKETIEMFFRSLEAHNIAIGFVSGGWGRDFSTLLAQNYPDISLLLTSETIYSLESLPLVAETVIDIIKRGSGTSALVAAKNFYFGVGGSVPEFVDYVNRYNRQNAPSVELSVVEIGDSQLKRSIVEMKKGDK